MADHAKPTWFILYLPGGVVNTEELFVAFP